MSKFIFTTILLYIGNLSFAQSTHQLSFINEVNHKPYPNLRIEITGKGFSKIIYTNAKGLISFKPTGNNYTFSCHPFGNKMIITVNHSIKSTSHIKIYLYKKGYSIWDNGKIIPFSKYINLYTDTLKPGIRASKDIYRKETKTYTKETHTIVPIAKGSSYVAMDMSVERIAVEPSTTKFTKSIKSTFGKSMVTNTKAGLLTAGEINDFSKWKLWKDISNGELSSYAKRWGYQPENRYSVMVLNRNKKPVVNALVKLLQNEKTIWTAQTDNTGKAELWKNIYFSDSGDNDLSLQIIYKKVSKTVNNITEFHNGINKVKLNVGCESLKNIDIAFIVDATGSMGDEIEYLKSELNDVIQQTKVTLPGMNIRLGSVFYRDKGDLYMTRTTPFSSDINQTIQFIKQQSAGGGGDEPEGVDTALSAAIRYMDWDETSVARLAFLVLDAPPHQDMATMERVKKLSEEAAAKGIRLIPITASGMGKTTEYLMRCLALATNGTYIFLTDDSGIGNAHIKPTTDHYKVELLNNLLVRVIKQFSFHTGCDDYIPAPDSSITDTFMVSNPNQLQPSDSIVVSDSTQENVEQQPDFKSYKVYPNPTRGDVYIEIDGNIQELFLTDISGKILQRIDTKEMKLLKQNLSEYPSGIYYFKYLMTKGSFDAKVVLIRE